MRIVISAIMTIAAGFVVGLQLVQVVLERELRHQPVTVHIRKEIVFTNLRPAPEPTQIVPRRNANPPVSRSQFDRRILRRSIARHFAKGDHAKAEQIALCENPRLDPGAISKPNADRWKSRDRGVFQINDYWHAHRVDGDVDKLLDPDTNIRIAADIRRSSGWGAWTCNRIVESQESSAMPE